MWAGLDLLSSFFLVDQVENEIVIETKSYGDRPNPLYLLLENYRSCADDADAIGDMLDIVIISS